MSSPPLKADPARADPYRNFRFRMKWAIASLTIQNEGWKRDDGAVEPDEANHPPS